MATYTTYTVYRDGNPGSRPKTFKRKSTVDMTATWKGFNAYAKKNGFTEPVESVRYFGALAWKNPNSGAVMDLRKATEEAQR